jgi:hypothetical protein
VDVEWSNLIAVFLARNCGRGRIPILGRSCEDARLVFGVQPSHANREFVLARLTQGKDATRVRAGRAYSAFPWVPCRQVDGSSATAELLDDLEEGHVEVAHSDGHLVLLAQCMTPSPTIWQVTWPNAVREVVVYVHRPAANLVAEVADALVQYDFGNHAAAVTMLLVPQSFVPPLPMQALEGNGNVDDNNQHDGTYLSATNDKILQGVLCCELIRNCG